MQSDDEPIYVELARDGVDSEAVAAIAQAEAQRDRESPFTKLVEELNLGELAQSAIGLMQAQKQAEAVAQAPKPEAADVSETATQAATDGGPKTRTEKRLEELGVKESDEEESPGEDHKPEARKRAEKYAEEEESRDADTDPPDSHADQDADRDPKEEDDESE